MQQLVLKYTSSALAGMSKLAPGKEKDMEAEVARTIPVGRMGERADIALACVYLASSAASFVSGAHFDACVAANVAPVPCCMILL